MDEACKKILSRLQAQCARREYCVSDIRAKALAALDKALLPPAYADDIVSALLADGYVDELRYAEAFCRDKSSLTGWGPLKIRLALRAKRIPDDVIGEALGNLDPERSDARLRSLVAAKRKSLEGDPQARLKLIRFVLSRGYEYDDVRRFVDARDD